MCVHVSFGTTVFAVCPHACGLQSLCGAECAFEGFTILWGQVGYPMSILIFFYVLMCFVLLLVQVWPSNPSLYIFMF
jgi:hypothetical protein